MAKCGPDCKCDKHVITGDSHPRWQGDAVSRKQFHKRIPKIRGLASKYPCDDCGTQAYDWAHVHSLDWRNVYNYVPLCHKCHMEYDKCPPGCKCGLHKGNGSRKCEPDCSCGRHTGSGNWQ